jgi:integrase
MSMKRHRRRKQTWGVSRIKDPRYPGLTVRVTEVVKGGMLYVIWKKKGELQKTRSLQRRRADLGVTEKEQHDAARTIGLDFLPEIVKLDKERGQPPLPKPVVQSDEVLTLARLVDLYELRGSLTASDSYRREQTQKLRRLAAFFGPDKPVVSLSQPDVDAWVKARRDPAEGQRRVRQAAIWGDIVALKIALSWATKEKAADGTRLLTANPLAEVHVEKETAPRRPIADPDRRVQLKKVARGVSPTLDLVLDLLWETGHRLGAVLGLRWQDVLFEPKEAAELARELESDVGWTDEEFPLGGVHFYAGRRANNKSFPHVRPMTPVVRAALERARQHAAAIAGAWIFADPADATKPLDRWRLTAWLRAAEAKAKLPHLKGGAFHPFRRAWATRKKHFADVDAALVGGWRDVETMHRSYVKSDVETRRAIVKAG